MNRLVLLPAICLFVATASTPQYTKLGFTAGYLFACSKEKYGMTEISGNNMPGISIGLMADFPIRNKISFQPNLNLIQKRIRKEEDFGNGSFEKTNKRINYLELPMNLLFNGYCKSGTFSIGTGPVFSFALFGKSIYETELGSGSRDLSFGNDPAIDDMKRFDFGINVLAGYRFRKGFSLSSGYNAGLLNLNPDGANKGVLKRHYFNIRLGYSLEKKLCKKNKF